jgi:hypothetical protein
MDIIIRIPPAYFIHINGDHENFSRWINIAHVVSIERFRDQITIRFIDDRAITLDGQQKTEFLNEIFQLMARYKVTES